MHYKLNIIWKEQLKILEKSKKWDEAIDFMKEVIEQNPEDIDVYLSMNYLLMNLLVEEDYDDAKFPYYAVLLKKYFDESYAKFSENPEYLYFIARIAVISEWYFNLTPEDVENMLQKALELDPINPVYQYFYYRNNDSTNIPEIRNKIILYAQSIFDKDSLIQKILKDKGSLGEYLLEIMTNWAKRMLKDMKSITNFFCLHEN